MLADRFLFEPFRWRGQGAQDGRAHHAHRSWQAWTVIVGTSVRAIAEASAHRIVMRARSL
ncbi:hypothetical protein GCM10011609_85740 [Lentzea pudingi]|uniref:Uncharacterized protein n=1 Tax=Lentzea pudingi TaxID=1789439 RepID=A0ABQ2ITN8_9PSEU|nr:hypothetical protein [Lentzea pudingi]GGN29014.1 hypothetical protein GCM10011609_85740 [Lentzea pudingi]